MTDNQRGIALRQYREITASLLRGGIAWPRERVAEAAGKHVGVDAATVLRWVREAA